MMNKLTPADLVRRRPVWLALSDMFLDTDTAILRPTRAKTLADSGFSTSELDRILVEEVSPVCGANLMNVAGEWAGFDPTWLEQAILRKQTYPLKLLRRMIPSQAAKVIADEWEATKGLMSKPV